MLLWQTILIKSQGKDASLQLGTIMLISFVIIETKNSEKSFVPIKHSSN